MILGLKNRINATELFVDCLKNFSVGLLHGTRKNHEIRLLRIEAEF
jgi:hypothetical protein